jgi:hypothetical protein
MPDSSALSTAGKKEGQVLMVRNAAGGVEAHQWSVATRSWSKIGDVVGGVGSGTKKLHEGAEYDYVFDVDIADGVPPLKLPYNLAENPYTAALRFINKNDLPQSYLEQVVHFIEKNSETKQLGSNDEYVDPYTGASRYQAQQPSASSSSSAAGAAPSHARGAAAAYTQGINPDPFTQSAPVVAAPAASTSKAASTGKLLPQRDYLSFASINAVAVQTKVEAFSAELEAQSVSLAPPASSLSIWHTRFATAHTISFLFCLVPSLRSPTTRSTPSRSFSLSPPTRLLPSKAPSAPGHSRTAFPCSTFCASSRCVRRRCARHRLRSRRWRAPNGASHGLLRRRQRRAKVEMYAPCLPFERWRILGAVEMLAWWIAPKR